MLTRHSDVNVVDSSLSRASQVRYSTVLYLVDYEITIPDMSRALGIGEGTIKRRMRECNIPITDGRTALGDE